MAQKNAANAFRPYTYKSMHIHIQNTYILDGPWPGAQTCPDAGPGPRAAGLVVSDRAALGRAQGLGPCKIYVF
jgi:hypothetical protein